MRLDDRLRGAQQRCAADLLGVHHTFQLAQTALDAQIAELGDQILQEDFFQHPQQRFGDALGQFQHDVADKAVADDDVHITVHDVARLDVARKVDAGVCLQQLVGLAVGRRALRVLRAVVDKRDLRRFAAHDLLGVDAAHRAEGVQHFGAALDVRTAVQQQEILLGAGHRGGQRRALDTLDRAHDETGADVQRTGGAGTDKGIGLAVLQHGQTLHKAGILFVAHSLDRVIVHVDGLGAVEDLKRCKVDFILFCAVADGFFLTQQHQLHAVAELRRGLAHALQNAQRGVVAAHGIH